MRNIRCLLATAASIASLSSAAAHAQDTAQPTQGAASAAQTDDRSADTYDIVVTAQRREERLQRTPVAVTALNSAALEQRGITRLENISASTPTLQITPVTASPNAIAISMRGALEQNGGTITSESPASIYIDDVYQSRLQSANYDLADIVRVEVLRGPQGTLYGRNSMTGAIKLVTRQPNGETWLNADVSYASFNEFKGKVSVGVPITGNLAVAASGFYSDRSKGWQYNEVLNKRVGTFTRFGAQLALGLYDVENLEAVLTARYSAGLSDGMHFAPMNLATGGTAAAGFYNTRTPRDADGDTRDKSLSLRLGYDFGSITVRSITALQRMTDYWAIDFSGGYDLPGTVPTVTVPGFYRISDGKQRQFTQEFQVLGTALEDRLNWIVGAFYFDENAEQAFTRDEIGAFFITYAPGKFNSKSKSLAFYGQLDYEIAPGLTGSVGIRHTDDKKDFVGLAPLAPGLNAPLFTTRTEADAKVWTPRFNVRYEFSPTVMAYGTVARGYRAGSFNSLVVADTTFGSAYKPEFAWSYELGLKAQTADRKAYINLAAYYEELSDLQTTASVGGVSFAIQNAAKAQVAGIEWEAGIRPIKGLNIYTSGAYTDDKYLELDPATSAALNGADRLPMISRWQYQVGATYEFDLGSSGAIHLAADYNHRGPYYVQVSLDPVSRIVANDRVNGSISYTTENERFELYGQVTNLTNSKDWAVALAFFPGVFGTLFPQEPRIVRVGMRYKM